VGLSAVLGVLAAGLLLAPLATRAASNDYDFEDFSTGSVNGQQDWSMTGGYDVAVVNPSSFPDASGYGFGTRALRISNYVASGSFGDQTIAPPLSASQGAGEGHKTKFDASFDIGSATASYQSGLSVGVAPDDGNGARMSYVRFDDAADGIHVHFFTVTDNGAGNAADFVDNVGPTLSHGNAHHIQIVVQFAAGPDNDLVKLYVDNSLVETGGSWEQYYRHDPEAAPNNLPLTRTLIFLARAQGGVNGQGYLFDNVSYATSNVAQCTTTCWVDSANGSDANGGTSATDAKKHIQAAIDTVNSNGTIKVRPGHYDEEATNRAPSIIAGGTYNFGLFIPASLTGVTIEGVDNSNAVITNPTATQADITTYSDANFGPDGIVVEGADTTFKGLQINGNLDPTTLTENDNKTFEVAADGFTLKNSKLHVYDGANPFGGSVYFNDPNSLISTYTIDNNRFTDGTSIDITGHAGTSGPVSGRQITNNVFNLQGATYPGVSFTGAGTTVPWFVGQVGGATISGNSFTGSTVYIRSRGTVVDESQFDWKGWFDGNTFDGAVMAGPNPESGTLTGYTYSCGAYTCPNTKRIASTITGGLQFAATNDTVLVKADTYDEDVAIGTNGVTLKGQGVVSTTITGPIGGSGSTVSIAANNVTVTGFTITRDGNNTTDWNNAGLNTAGISIQGQAISGADIHGNKLAGLRTGIDINNSNGHSIHNNVIDNNRTGMILRNQTDNLSVTENKITNNWTVGVLFLDGSGGTNSPVQTALNSTFSNNDISGNWYGQVVDRQTGGSIPAPGTTNLKNFSGNWYGSTSPVVTTANSTEPGYAAQIPVAFGGTATPPGSQPDIAGPASANIDLTPYLASGTDTDSGTYGFQGATDVLYVTAAGSQTGSTGRVQEGVADVDANGTLHVNDGTYASSQGIVIAKKLTLSGQSEGGTIIDQSAMGSDYGLWVNHNDVSLDHFTVKGPNGVGKGGASYGIKVDRSPSFVDGVTISHVTAQDSWKTNIDLHGATNALVTNVTATGAGAGNGIAWTDSSNSTMTGVTVSGNAWGGIAIYTHGTFVTGGSDNITLNGTNSITAVAGTAPIYVEEQGSPSAFPVTNLHLPAAYNRIVRTSDGGFDSATDKYTFYFTSTGSAQTFAEALNASLSGNHAVVSNLAQDHYYVEPNLSINAAIGAANANETVEFAAGTYTQDVTINKVLTLTTPQTGNATSGRTALGVNESTINGTVGVQADVDLDGFSFTRSLNANDGAIGVYIKAAGSGTTVKNDFFKSITNAGTGSQAAAQAIYLENGPNNVTITDNVIDGVSSERSAKGIFVGDSATDVAATGIDIERNTISNVSSTQKGAYGITTNAGSSGSHTGSAELTIKDNTITGLSSPGWVHAIGIEGDAPVAIITGNTISSISDTDATGGLDQRAVWFEADAYLANASVHRNSLDVGSAAYGVIVENSATTTVDATCNWYGSASGPGDQGPGTGSKVSTHVTFAPWLITSNLNGSCTAISVNADQGNITKNEGQAFHATGSFTGTIASITANNAFGAFVDNGDGTWKWDYTSTDNFTATITVTGHGQNGTTATDSFVATANNVAPTATFNSDASVLFNGTIHLSLTSPVDPGTDDVLTYAFKCGTAAYSSPSPTNTGTCTAPSTPGTFAVKGKIIDDDGDSNEYSANVTITQQDISVSPASHDFGDQNISAGATSSFAFTVKNDGNADLTITGASIVGSGGSHYAIDTNDCDGEVLAHNETCDVNVVFDPLTAGSKSATLRINSDDPDENPVDLTLDGTGTAPGASLTPSSKNYGNVVVGSSSDFTFTFTNTGTGPVHIGSVSLAGSNPGQFTLGTDACSSTTVVASGTCAIHVSFDPTVAGPKSATLSVPSNADSSPTTASLSGTGTQPDASISPTSKAYGNVVVGSSSSDQIFTVTNIGTGPLHITTVSITGTNPGQFTLGAENCSSTIVSAGNSCDIHVTFDPTSAGGKSATVSVASDAVSGSPTTASLTGTGMEPAASIAPTTKDFGNVDVGSSSSDQTFTLTNTGTAPLHVGTVSKAGTNPGQFVKGTDTCSGATIAAGDTCTIHATFNPTNLGSKSATLSVPSDAPGSPTTATLTGVGTTPPQATITVALSTNPDGQPFDFSGTNGIGNFQLTDGGTNSMQFAVSPGSYDITETQVNGWANTSLTCDSPQTIKKAQHKVTVQVANGDSTTCTFTNVQRLPDAQISLTQAGPYSGDNVYSSTVIPGQTASRVITSGQTRSFYVKLQNDSPTADSFKIKATITGSAKYTVKVFRTTANVTSQVTAGTYALNNLAPGQSVVLRIDVTAAATTPTTSVKDVLIAMRSTSAPGTRDVVKAHVTAQ